MWLFLSKDKQLCWTIYESFIIGHSVQPTLGRETKKYELQVRINYAKRTGE